MKVLNVKLRIAKAPAAYVILLCRWFVNLGNIIPLFLPENTFKALIACKVIKTNYFIVRYS
jgi:hypothetical protein